MALLLLVCTANAWKYERNTISKKKNNEEIITHLKWLITLVIDIKLYKRLLARLKAEINTLRRARMRVAQKYVPEEKY